MVSTEQRTHPCIYCGRITDLAPDHVPPSGLFVRPRPSNLCTVPSCRTCNQGFSKDDEFLRNVLVLRKETAIHPASATLLQSVYRSLERPEARGLAKLLFESLRDFEIHTKAGVYLGKAPGFLVDDERIGRILERFTRALFFAETREVLPREVRITPDVSFEESAQRRERVAQMLSNSPIRAFGRNEFQYQWARAADSPYASIWLFAFYGTTLYVSITAPPFREFGIAAPAV